LKAFLEDVKVASYRDLEDQDKKYSTMKSFEIECKFQARKVK